MSQPTFLTTLYGLLLRLYPRPFRQEFAAEMQQVFAAVVARPCGGHTHQAAYRVPQ